LAGEPASAVPPIASRGIISVGAALRSLMAPS
jgi:hypothetical protein